MSQNTPPLPHHCYNPSGILQSIVQEQGNNAYTSQVAPPAPYNNQGAGRGK